MRRRKATNCASMARLGASYTKSAASISKRRKTAKAGFSCQASRLGLPTGEGQASSSAILAENYPKKKWIKPVGYSVMSVVGISMINNGVHWASDYPLGIAVGYIFGKMTVKMNRLVRGETRKNKKR